MNEKKQGSRLTRRVPLVLLIAFFGRGCFAIQANSTASPEFQVLQSIKPAVELFAEKNQGKAPTNWNEVALHCDLDRLNFQLAQVNPKFLLQANYVFLTNRVSAPRKWRGDVVLIRSKAITNVDGQTGRYLISWNGQEATISWFEEAVIEKMLAEPSVTLPEPDPALVRRADDALKKALAEDAAWRRKAVKVAWRVWLTEKVKGWFVSSGNTNSPSGTSGQQTVGTIKVVPVLLALLAFLGCVALVFMRFRRRQRSS